MKLSIAALVLATTVAATSASTRNVQSLLQRARRVDEAQQENEYAFLGNYNLKLLGCKSGESYVNAEGNKEYSSVIFRLCPADSCSDDGDGCSSGYGDYIVGINTFVQSYLEDKREEMKDNGDDNFDLGEMGECSQWEVDKDGQEDGDEEKVYSVGPACSDDGKSIKLEFFNDEYCSSVSEDVSFEDISNGLSLPYSDGGFVSSNCESCLVYNDNNEAEFSDMCIELYESSGKCEVQMESVHNNGAQSGSCEFIESLMPKSSNGGAGKAIGWVLFILVVVGVAFAGYTFMKKKQANQDKDFGLMNA